MGIGSNSTRKRKYKPLSRFYWSGGVGLETEHGIQHSKEGCWVEITTLFKRKGTEIGMVVVVSRKHKRENGGGAFPSEFSLP